jgi:hypothetical protein
MVKKLHMDYVVWRAKTYFRVFNVGCFLISATVPALITGEVREGSGQFDQGLQGQRVGFASALQEYQGGSASHQAYGVGQGQAIP